MKTTDFKMVLIEYKKVWYFKKYTTQDPNKVHLSLNNIPWIRLQGKEASLQFNSENRCSPCDLDNVVVMYCQVTLGGMMIGLAYSQDYLDACFTCELATANTLSPEAAL